MKEKIFILEDDENRIIELEKWLSKKFKVLPHIITAKKVSTAKRLLLTSRNYLAIFLDHDLGEGEDAIEIAKLIKHNKVKYNQLFIHSMNPVGSANIKNILPDAIVLPFNMLVKS
jgi:response regulator of citrate/malate metabolism